MLSDIFTCLLVTFRLFLVLVFIVNIIAWLLFGCGEDDDEDTERQDHRSPDGPTSNAVPCCFPRCVFTRRQVNVSSQRPPDNDESAAPQAESDVEALLSDVVEKLEDDRQSTGANSTATEDVELSETEGINTMRQEPMSALFSNADQEFDDRTASRTVEEFMKESVQGTEETLFAGANIESDGPVSLATTEQGAVAEDEYEDEDQMTTTENAAPDATQQSQMVDATVSADSDEYGKPTLREAQPGARRPASHS